MANTTTVHAAHPFLPQGSRRHLAALAMISLLTACGGGGGDTATAGGNTTGAVDGTTGSTGTDTGSGTTTGSDGGLSGAAAVVTPPTRAQAFRLLTQASFGPTDTTLAQVTSQGLTGWLDSQLALPPVAAHRTRWLATTKTIKLTRPTENAGPNEVGYSFYQQALQANDQLRQRVAFALSEIFVVSLSDLTGERAEALADFQDMLGRNAFGNFRTLLQDVSMHPAMGMYLSHIKNRKGDLSGTRVPDQNFAREVMQLFTIGLRQLNLDGSLKLDGAGQPIDTYTASDIAGMSTVFTSFSWGGPDTTAQRFFAQTGYTDVNRMAMPMQGYPQFHATIEKRFLGTVIPAQAVANPAASVTVALDTLFQHPNVGPFIGRQLIQRLVTSQPSPAYVARVAAVFNNNGVGVRGDMKAVVRAILTDIEARDDAIAANPQFGKVREPVLRLTAFLRAYKAKSDSGKVLIGNTDDPGNSLGQSPLRSPGVFNFFRPGYVPSSGEAAALGMTVPEMQTTSESSVAGYANYMLIGVDKGVGLRGTTDIGTRPDLQPDYTTELTQATVPATLVSTVTSKLLPAPPSAALTNEILTAVNSIVIPAPKRGNTNAQAIATAKRNRVLTAVLLTLVSPEFLVQK